MAIQWPHVKAWLADTIPTLAGLSDVAVTNGPEVSGEAPSRYVTVGVVDDEEDAGTFERSLIYDGSVWSETGEVRSTIVAQSGDSDPTDAEVGAFAIAEAIDAKVQADPTLDGTLSPDSEVRSSFDVKSISNSRGTATELVHVLTYTTTN